jgi:hypothetical protein
MAFKVAVKDHLIANLMDSFAASGDGKYVCYFDELRQSVQVLGDNTTELTLPRGGAGGQRMVGIAMSDDGGAVVTASLRKAVEAGPRKQAPGVASPSDDDADAEERWGLFEVACARTSVADQGAARTEVFTTFTGPRALLERLARTELFACSPDGSRAALFCDGYLFMVSFDKQTCDKVFLHFLSRASDIESVCINDDGVVFYTTRAPSRSRPAQGDDAPSACAVWRVTLRACSTAHVCVPVTFGGDGDVVCDLRIFSRGGDKLTLCGTNARVYHVDIAKAQAAVECKRVRGPAVGAEMRVPPPRERPPPPKRRRAEHLQLDSLRPVNGAVSYGKHGNVFYFFAF